MPLPLEEYVRLILSERNRGQRLHEAVRSGWAAFLFNQPRRHLWRRKSSSRHMVWEEVATQLAQLADDDGVEVLEHKDTLSLIIEREVMIRLKHADVALVTQNYPTDEAREYDDHEKDLFGRSGLQRVRLCYVLNEFETDLLWVGIAAHSQGRFLWKIELAPEGMVAPEPRLPIEAVEVDTAKLARLKNVSGKQEKKNKEDRG